ncbi:MAG: bifunctional UDP-N-acetylglucosamine diphosphorylase/glucosamine-1-phosphate N-acetyltransferase GlmU [Woeseiaceae bacterium]|nr:bifunctional UDP-N-acetylglucosamine diphosphorylase/glucosamine-1-phosphate N-acetyltransferase GlmU [Woeseiaceae bacterium]
MALSVLILAAGQGTRMRSNLPKVLQPLAGQPLLAHVIATATSLDAADICVVYGHGGGAVRDRFDGLPLRWALQAEQHGTGHAVQQAMPETPDENQVLVLAGDVPLLTKEALQALIGGSAPGELSVLTVDMDDPTGYGRIIRDGDSVTSIVEQKDADEEQLEIREINTGVMLASAENMKRWLAELKNDNAQGEYYLTDIVAMAVDEGIRVTGIKAQDPDEVMGINDKKQLAEAERALQKKRVEELMEQGVGFADPARVDIRGTLTCGSDVFIDVNAVIEGDVHLGDNTVVESNNLIRDSKLGANNIIHSNCHIEGAVTGDACEIGPFARLRPGASLANNVKVGNFVEIKKSTIADGSKVNHLTYIGDAQIGSTVNVGAGTITCNYDGANKHQTVIGDGAFIGSGVMLVAPVSVGKGADIGAGTTLTKSAPDEQLTVGRARQVSVKGWQRPTKEK